MKDEARILKLEKWEREQSMWLNGNDIDVRGDWENDPNDAWTPLPPLSDSAETGSKPSAGKKHSSPAQPGSQVLATHPLLDACRLAALVLATKFIRGQRGYLSGG